jgi:hypothetical protein
MEAILCRANNIKVMTNFIWCSLDCYEGLVTPVSGNVAVIGCGLNFCISEQGPGARYCERASESSDPIKREHFLTV